MKRTYSSIEEMEIGEGREYFRLVNNGQKEYDSKTGIFTVSDDFSKMFEGERDAEKFAKEVDGIITPMKLHELSSTRTYYKVTYRERA